MSQSKAIGNMSECDAEVTLVDQLKINEFARLNLKLEELKAMAQRKRKELQDLKDAADEMILLDAEEPVPILIGEAFVHFTQEDAEREIEKRKDELASEAAAIDSKTETIRSRMTSLKIDLYAKFGSSINLEPEPAS